MKEHSGLHDTRVPFGFYSTNPPGSSYDWFIPRYLKLSKWWLLLYPAQHPVLMLSWFQDKKNSWQWIYYLRHCTVVVKLRFAINLPFCCFSVMPLVKQHLAKCPFLSHLQHTSFAWYTLSFTCLLSHLSIFTSWCVCKFTNSWTLVNSTGTLAPASVLSCIGPRSFDDDSTDSYPTSLPQNHLKWSQISI